jgi:thiol-disulfide isomerase/thioredoxin
MKLKICLMGLLCLFFRLSAQNLIPPTGIKIGEKIPDIVISQIINYSAGSARLSDFKDKVIVLDFWATWCSSCIANFPKLYALKNKYPTQLQVLLVDSRITRDNEQMVRAFMEKRKLQYRLPSVVNDTSLIRLFPHQSMPHCVLIKNNVVLAITGADGITGETIAKFIEGKGSPLFVKADRKYDDRLPLFAGGNGGGPANYLYRSVLLGKVDNLPNSLGFTPAGNGLYRGAHVLNSPLPLLYTYAFHEFAAYKANRVILCAPHSANTLFDSVTALGLTNKLFTYESIFPPQSREEGLEIMQSDLFRYFRLKVDSQYRDTTCYMLKLAPNRRPRKADSLLKAETNIREHSGAPVYYTNLPIKGLANLLENEYHSFFIDDTQYLENVDLRLPADLLNFTALSKSLSEQGLSLEKGKRKISFLVLTEQPRASRFNKSINQSNLTK